MRELIIDLPLAWQAVRGRPWWSAGIVLNLALVLAFLAALSGAHRGAARTRLDVRRPDRLVSVATPAPGGAPQRVPAPVFEALRSRAHGFAGLAAAHLVQVNTDQTPPRRLDVQAVTPGWFETVQPGFALGRPLTTEDHAPGQADVPAVISHALWQRRFDGRRDVLGRQIVLGGGRRLSVKGVLSERFVAPSPASSDTDLWIPLPATAHAAGAISPGLTVLGRLRDGTSAQAARREVERIVAELARRDPRLPAGMTGEVARYPEEHAVHARVLRHALHWAVMLLLVGLTTAAIQFLGRWLGRWREHAMRMSAGATPGRVARHAFLESGLLALMGLAIGLPLGQGLLGLLKWVYIDARWTNIGFREARLDPVVLVGTLGCALLLGLVVGAPAALVTGRPRIHAILKASARSHSGGRGARLWREALVAAQMAVLMVMSTQMGVVVNQVRLQGERHTPDAVVHVSPSSVEAGGAALLDAARALREALARRPEVKAVALVTPPPGGAVRGVRPHRIRPAAGAPGPTAGEVVVRAVEGDARVAMNVVLVTGRWLRDGERGDGPTPTVVDRQVAQHFGGEAAALGGMFALDPPDPLHPRGLVIVGVASAVHGWSYDPMPPSAYVAGPLPGRMPPSVLVRLQPGAGERASDRVEAAALGVGAPDVFLIPEPYASLFGSDLMAWLARLLVVFLFTMVAGVLSTIALLDVGRALIGARRTEIAIRIAVGATPLHVMSQVARTGWVAVAVGVTLGAAIAVPTVPDWAWSPWMMKLVAVAVVSSPVVLFLIMLWPAWKACRVPVLESLRHE